MASKTKIHRSPAKQNLREKDAADNKQFLTVVIVATVVLMVLMYFIFSSN